MNETLVEQDPGSTVGDAPVNSMMTPPPATASQVVVPAQGCSSCSAPVARATAQAASDPWVYVIGDVDPRYPSLSVEKEAMGTMARAKVTGLSNDAALHSILGMQENAYLVREMCFVLLVQEVETYILVPRSPLDYPMLVEACKTERSAVIGTIGPVADPSACNGLTLPYLIFDVIYNFDRSALIADLPLPKGAAEQKFRAAAADIFNQIVSLAPSGRFMERAVAFLLMKDPQFYQVIWDALNNNSQLTSVETKPAPVTSPSQNLVDVMVTTTDRGTGVQTCMYARVNLSGKLPYVVNYWQRCIRP